MEIGLVELLEAVLLVGYLLGRLENRETVLSDEGILVPRFAWFVMEGRSVSLRHEGHQNGNRDDREKDTVKVSLDA